MFLLVHTPVVSASEYLEREKLALDRSEYNNREITQIPASQPSHSLICVNLLCNFMGFADELNFLQQKAFYHIFSIQLRLYIPEYNSFTYPDVIMIDKNKMIYDEKDYYVQNPLLIIEVFSPKTENNDRGWKFEAYRAIPSLQEYVLVAQNRCHIEQYSRNSENQWLLKEYSNPQNFIQFTSIPFQLEINTIYENTEIYIEK